MTIRAWQRAPNTCHAGRGTRRSSDSLCLQPCGCATHPLPYLTPGLSSGVFGKSLKIRGMWQGALTAAPSVG
uniref:Uncharacterized protein n=1 Tax=Phasianus colchicus TaxID=9054 RepID=A0A669PV24_PHACC